MTNRSAAVLAVAGGLLLPACGGEDSSESGVATSDPRGVGVAFVEGIAGRDPAVCDLVGSGMVTELTATAPDKSCAEAVESGDAHNIFFVADGEEILAALPDAELEQIRQGSGEEAQRLSIEPGPGAVFNVILIPIPDGEGWQVDATTAGQQTELLTGGKGKERAD